MGKKEELLGQKVKIIGLSKQTGETLNVFQRLFQRNMEARELMGSISIYLLVYLCLQLGYGDCM
jgi:hypothetical protein